MRIAVPKEIKNGETRVAVTPDIVKKYKYMGKYRNTDFTKQ